MIFIGLNIIRVLSMVSLILVFASSIFVMVNDVTAFNEFQRAQQNNPDAADILANCDYIEGSTVPNQAAGIFWAVVSRLLIIFQVIVLFLSEIGWPAKFFDDYFPVLSKSFGLGALGIFESLIGATVLSHHVDDFTLVAAFFLFALGCVNMLLGLIFREKAKDKRSITFWRAEAKGILPTHLDNRPVFVNATPAFGGTEKIAQDFGGANTFRSMSDASSRAGYGFGRQGEKAAGLKGFMISRPVESLPRYAAKPSSTHMRRESSVSSSSRGSGSSFASPGSAALAGPNAPYRHDAPPVFKSSSTAI
jgi:hypothetical protein